MSGGLLLADLAAERVATLPAGVGADDAAAIGALLGVGAEECAARMRRGELVTGPPAAVWRRLLRARPALGFEIVGASMLPTLLPGERVRLFPAPRAPSPGDLVVAALGGTVIAHRVVAVGGRSLVLRGDNSPRNDPLVPMDDLIGVVSRRQLHLAVRLRAALTVIRTGEWRKLWLLLRATRTMRWRKISPVPSPPRPAPRPPSSVAAPAGPASAAG